MPFLLFLNLLALPSRVHAEASTLWNCTTNTELIGDANHYREWGQDSWRGTSTLSCYSSSWLAQKKVSIVYIGPHVGVGVNQSSSLPIQLNMIMSKMPDLLQITAHVHADESSGSEVRWETESGVILINALVQNKNLPAHCESLRYGTLDIHESP